MDKLQSITAGDWALIALCLIFPWLSVLMKKGPDKEFVISILLSLCFHIPGIIYGIYIVLTNPEKE